MALVISDRLSACSVLEGVGRYRGRVLQSCSRLRAWQTFGGRCMAAVKLPDGRELAIEPGERARDVAERIGKRLARDAVVAKLNGELIDLDAPLDGGGDFEVVTRGSSEGLEVLRHSTAHAMAQAVLELYPGSKLTIGPPIENGFYYDIEFPQPLKEEDLGKIEGRMKELAKL